MVQGTFLGQAPGTRVLSSILIPAHLAPPRACPSVPDAVPPKRLMGSPEVCADHQSHKTTKEAKCTETVTEVSTGQVSSIICDSLVNAFR